MGDYLYSIGKGLLSISIKQALSGAGIGLVTYAGMSSFLESAINKATAQMQSGDAIALAMLGLSGMDTALSLVISGVMVRAVIFSSKLGFRKL